MTERDVPPTGRSDPPTESAARLRDESLIVHRLVSLLGRIRNGALETLDAIQSKAFDGSLDEVFPVYREDVSVAVSYLVKLGVSHEEAQQLRREYERAWDAGGVLQLLMRNPPIVINDPARDDDPDDSEVARVKHVNAERRAQHQRKVDDQRGIAVDALSALLKRVDDLVEAIESIRRGPATGSDIESEEFTHEGKLLTSTMVTQAFLLDDKPLFSSSSLHRWEAEIPEKYKVPFGKLTTAHIDGKKVYKEREILALAAELTRQNVSASQWEFDPSRVG